MDLGEQQPSTGIRVLIVDDHPSLRLGLRVLLCSAPHIDVVGEADDGDRVLSLVRELAPDVVVMDMSMQRVGGLEATRELHARAPGVKVLALSVSEERSLVRLMFDTGATGYALKRSLADELVRAVRIVAGGGTYVDPSLAAAIVSAEPARLCRVEPGCLSVRESEVLQHTARGLTAKEVAAELGLSPRTLETYKARAMTKLNLRTRAQLMRYALDHGMLR
jgi:two-component system, NarL family, response regulator NreC